MFEESGELLLELHILHQLIYIRNPAQENSHLVLTVQVLDVTLSSVAWVFTLQTNLAQSQHVDDPSSCLAAQSQLICRCVLGYRSKDTSAYLTKLADCRSFCIIWQQLLQCKQLLLFKADTLCQLVLHTTPEV